MNSAIIRYVSLVVAAALGATFALFVTDPAFNPDFARAALTFGVISVLAQLLSYRTGGSSTGSVSFIPVLASAAIAPNWVSVLAVVASSLTGQIVAKRNALRTIFNPAQEAFALALAMSARDAMMSSLAGLAASTIAAAITDMSGCWRHAAAVSENHAGCTKRQNEG